MLDRTRVSGSAVRCPCTSVRAAGNFSGFVETNRPPPRRRRPGRRAVPRLLHNRINGDTERGCDVGPSGRRGSGDGGGAGVGRADTHRGGAARHRQAEPVPGDRSSGRCGPRCPAGSGERRAGRVTFDADGLQAGPRLLAATRLRLASCVFRPARAATFRLESARPARPPRPAHRFVVTRSCSLLSSVLGKRRRAHSRFAGG